MKADQLQGYLARSAKDGRLDPFWLLTGSDAFLAVEAGDAIRAEARRQGYTDRQVLDMNASADWSRLTMAAADIGMFDDRKIVDVRLSTGNPGKNGAPAIVKYLDNPIDGVVTLITMPAPDWTVTKEAWWGALQRKATVVDCSPVERATPRLAQGKTRPPRARHVPRDARLLRRYDGGQPLCCRTRDRKALSSPS